MGAPKVYAVGKVKSWNPSKEDWNKMKEQVQQEEQDRLARYRNGRNPLVLTHAEVCTSSTRWQGTSGERKRIRQTELGRSNFLFLFLRDIDPHREAHYTLSV